VPGTGSFDRLSAERLSELIVQSEQELPPFQERYQQQTASLLASGQALKPFTAHLLAAPGTATWFTNLDRKLQEWASVAGIPPHESFFHPDLRSHGAGNTKPRLTFWTSTSLTSHTSSWLHYLRWGEDRQDPPYPRWRVEVSPSARVYEIHGPQAWHRLCLAYPAPSSMAYHTDQSDALIEPDWQAVSQDWDGIHLSVGGALTTERVRWGTPGRQTHLFGWSVESTAWLRWVFGRVEPLPDGS
jgi:hypothetical protein